MPGARLLLVDDEEALLALLQKYLEKLGYEVHACAGPEIALERFRSDPSAYALVLTDLTLPGLSGEQMLEQMRASHPQLRAIVTSGYPYQPRATYVSFLQKPFLPKMLAEEIEKRLK
jgi:two-component system cell cycle sensor histidine kinase/response regulator CckA